MNLNTVGPWSTENPGSVSFLGRVYVCSAVRCDGAGEVQGMLVYDEQSINADRYRWMAIWMGEEGKLCARTGYTEGEARAIVDSALRGRSVDDPSASSNYADGHVAGDRDRFARCKEDVSRALGLKDDPATLSWTALIEKIRALRGRS